MQVPIRKPGKYTHFKPDFNLTEAKFSEFKKELAGLKASRPEAIKEVKRLAELGDFSENAAYQVAKGRLRGINQRIFDLENYLNKAVIIEPAGSTAGTVQLGSRVTIEINGLEKTYLILGSSEADPGKNIISHNSPIGSALINHQVGDEIKVQQKGRVIKCKIIKII